MKIDTFVSYKGFTGTIENDGLNYHGKICNIDDFVNYTSDSIAGLYDEYKKAVDDYIEFKKDILNTSTCKGDIDEVSIIMKDIIEDISIIDVSIPTSILTINFVSECITLCRYIRLIRFNSIYGINLDIETIRKNLSTPDSLIRLERNLIRLKNYMSENNLTEIKRDISYE